MDKTTGADPLFLGLTRPAMVWGVPQPFFVMNGMLSMIVFLMSNSFVPLLIGAPLIHGLGYLACLREVRMFDLWRIKARFLRCRNRRYWGANSYDPFR
jgi:type IV secretion system protein VirB3